MSRRKEVVAGRHREHREWARKRTYRAATEGPDSALTRRSYSYSDLVGSPATIGIGAKVVEMPEVATSKNLFADIHRMIAALRPQAVA